MAVVKSVDYIFPDPNTEDGGPDPAFWATQGGLTGTPTSGGWQIADPGASASLLYFHAAPEFGGTNAVTFRGSANVPPVNDASVNAWAPDTNTIGFRLIVDDGIKQLVVGLGRDPATKARQVVVFGASGVAPIPFAWEHASIAHTYEIGRLPNGDFTVTVSDGDPNTGNAPVTRNVPAASLPATNGTAMVAFGMGVSGGATSRWTETHGTAATSQTDIDLDTRRLELDLGENEILFRGEVTLPAGVTINPPTETVAVKIANGSGIALEYSIPSGGFVQKKRRYRFESAQGTQPDVTSKLRQRCLSTYRFKFAVELPAPIVLADRSSVNVTLAFGSKVGTQALALVDKGDRLVFKRHGDDDDND